MHMNTKMTNKKVYAFQAAIGKVCIEHGVGLLVGVWFENKEGDAYGVVNVVDLAEKDMIIVGGKIADEIKKWAEDIQPGGWDMTVKGVAFGFKSK